jgi:hypothetical protein
MHSIRQAVANDADALWAILEPVFRAGETYTIPQDITKEGALLYWCGPSHETFVLEDSGRVLGTYFLKANQGGGGAHVANCGYITSSDVQGESPGRPSTLNGLARNFRLRSQLRRQR